MKPQTQFERDTAILDAMTANAKRRTMKWDTLSTGMRICAVVFFPIFLPIMLIVWIINRLTD